MIFEAWSWGGGSSRLVVLFVGAVIYEPKDRKLEEVNAAKRLHIEEDVEDGFAPSGRPDIIIKIRDSEMTS